jgi:hypothetical protein
MSSPCPRFNDYGYAGIVGVDAISILATGALFLTWFVMRLARLHVRSILKWYFYGFALIFILLYVATLQPCV